VVSVIVDDVIRLVDTLVPAQRAIAVNMQLVIVGLMAVAFVFGSLLRDGVGYLLADRGICHLASPAAGSGSLCFEITLIRWVCQALNSKNCGKLQLVVNNKMQLYFQHYQ
jgi:hypothetical protein